MNADSPLEDRECTRPTRDSGEPAAELGRAPQRSQARELAPQGLHLGRAVEAKQAAELRGRMRNSARNTSATMVVRRP